MRPAKTLASLRICAGSPESSLFDNGISTKISCVASVSLKYSMCQNVKSLHIFLYFCACEFATSNRKNNVYRDDEYLSRFFCE